MKRLLWAFLCLMQCFFAQAGFLGNEAEGKYRGIKSFIDSISLNDLALLPERIDEYAEKYNKDAKVITTFLREKIKRYDSLKQSTIKEASIKDRQLINGLIKNLKEKSAEIKSAIEKIQKSRFARKEKRLALDLYRHAIDTIAAKAEIVKSGLFKKPIPSSDVLDIANQVNNFTVGNFADFQTQLMNKRRTWDTIINQVMVEEDGIVHKAYLTELANRVLASDKNAIQEYRKKALEFQNPNTVYGAIMKALAPALLILK